jgi:hypothetical protein
VKEKTKIFNESNSFFDESGVCKNNELIKFEKVSHLWKLRSRLFFVFVGVIFQSEDELVFR